jgi:uncharacterized protein with NAD-binding domain and iron-sulfur cluster
MGTPKKTRVAVLGGGLGAMSAAFELTRTPALRERFEVTVYQQGWRLGGKGASGRNHRIGERIEEHGLHAFMGFYDNAFALMRAAYAEWQKNPDNPFQTWSDAFKPQYQVSLGEWWAGRWSAWNITFPTLPGEPGDGGGRPSRLHVLATLVAWLHGAAKQVAAHAPPHAPAPAITAEEQPATAESTHLGWVDRLIRELEGWIRDAGAFLRGLGDDLRRLVLLVELGIAVLRGYVADVLFSPRGYRAIDGLDFKAWLKKHGASDTVAWSSPVLALYDLGFAWRGGDTTDPDAAQAAAGVALQVALDLAFGCRGAPLWKMQAGMGDTVFSPLYEVLRQRGQRVEFFRRVENLRLSADGTRIEAIELTRQVDLAPGVEDYTPTRTVKGVVSWPAEPHWDQILGGEALRARLDAAGYTLESAWCHEAAGKETLHLGEDFDAVVVGISVAELKRIAPELHERIPSWTRALDTAATTPTQALQIWLDRDLSALGWTRGTTVMTAFSEPFDSWGEMSHLIVREQWPVDHQPKAIEYFCSALSETPDMLDFDDGGVPRAQEARVRAQASAFLQGSAGMLFPAATVPGQSGLDFNRLVDLEDRPPARRIEAQWVRANIDPTERYVLSPPGTIEARLHPGDPSLANSVAAGDWTYTTLCGGCAEAAAESGMLAAKALIQKMV